MSNFHSLSVTYQWNGLLSVCHAIQLMLREFDVDLMVR